MRILHLVDLAEHSSVAPLACAAAVHTLPASHTVWAIGSAPAPTPDAAHWRRFQAPLGRPHMAWHALRRAFKDAAGGGGGGAFDLVTAWSPGALCAAHAARLRLPLIGVCARAPAMRLGQVESRLQRAALDRCVLLCFSQTAAEAWRAAGAADLRIAPPRVPFDTSHLPDRAAARAMLGIDPQERVLGFLADPPSQGDARRFAYLCGLLTVGGRQATGLIHTHNTQIRRAARFVRDCGRIWRLVPWDGPLASAIAACDAAMVDIQVLPTHPLLAPDSTSKLQPTADALTICLAATLGVPVVIAGLPLANEARQAGIPVVCAADETPLSVAAGLFPIMDAPEPPRMVHHPGAGGLDVLYEIWLEQLNAPLPGFPLSLSSPIPPLPAAERAPALAEAVAPYSHPQA